MKSLVNLHLELSEITRKCGPDNLLQIVSEPKMKSLFLFETRWLERYSEREREKRRERLTTRRGMSAILCGKSFSLSVLCLEDFERF